MNERVIISKRNNLRSELDKDTTQNNRKHIVIQKTKQLEESVKQ